MASRHLPEEIGLFWQGTLTASRALARPPRRTPVAGPVTAIRQWDVHFSGYDGQPVAAWFSLPAGAGHAAAPLPCVVEYVGYGGGRGQAHEHLFWAAAGFAHLLMDVRGQGGGWRSGDTPDQAPPDHAGDSFFTKGLPGRESYYYRRLYTDAVLAVDAVRDARSFPEVDGRRVAVAGISQGGGLAVAAAALTDVAAAMPDVPGMGAWRTAMTLAETGPYADLAAFLGVRRHETEQALETLRLFDGAVLGAGAYAPALFSAGGRDLLVPAEAVREIAAGYGGPAELVEYPFNGHESGGAMHQLRQHAWLREVLGVESQGAAGEH